MREADELIRLHGHDSLRVRRYGEPLRPDRTTVRVHIAVQERIGVRASVVPSPTVRVQETYLLGVVRRCRPKIHPPNPKPVQAPRST